MVILPGDINEGTQFHFPCLDKTLLGRNIMAAVFSENIGGDSDKI